jgi:hypothetical protein
MASANEQGCGQQLVGAFHPVNSVSPRGSANDQGPSDFRVHFCVKIRGGGAASQRNGHNHAAPRTPLASPCFAATTGVSASRPNTYSLSRLGTF